MHHQLTEKSVWFAAVLAGLGICTWCWGVEAQTFLGSQNASSAAASVGLVTHVHESEGRPTRVIVIDPHQQVMAVYHIDRESGKIEPKSVRNLSWDLRMTEFNSDDPSPKDLEKAHQRLD